MIAQGGFTIARTVPPLGHAPDRAVRRWPPRCTATATSSTVRRSSGSPAATCASRRASTDTGTSCAIRLFDDVVGRTVGSSTSGATAGRSIATGTGAGWSGSSRHIAGTTDVAYVSNPAARREGVRMSASGRQPAAGRDGHLRLPAAPGRPGERRAGPRRGPRRSRGPSMCSPRPPAPARAALRSARGRLRVRRYRSLEVAHTPLAPGLLAGLLRDAALGDRPRPRRPGLHARARLAHLRPARPAASSRTSTSTSTPRDRSAVRCPPTSGSSSAGSCGPLSAWSCSRRSRPRSCRSATASGRSGSWSSRTGSPPPRRPIRPSRPVSPTTTMAC